MIKTGLINHFNRGEVDSRALARIDVKRVKESASSLIGFMPARLGNMVYRPGTAYLAELSTSSETDQHYLVPFVDTIDNSGIINFVDNVGIRFVLSDAEVAVSASPTTTIANATFTTDVASWTDNDDSGATSDWYDYGGGDGALRLTGNGESAKARRYQTMASTQHNVEHTLKFTIDHGPVDVKIGSSGNKSTEHFSGTLKPGYHFITFTSHATNDITITLENSKKYGALVDSIEVMGTSDTFELDFPSALVDNLANLRYAQSADIVFFAYGDGQHFEIEHRGDRSWSFVYHRADDGPFLSLNTSSITMTAGALSGDTTLTASEAFFESTHVGALFKLSSTGQTVSEANVAAEDTATGAIRVTGVDAARIFNVVITADTWTGLTVTLQSSVDGIAGGTWNDVNTYTTSNKNTTKNDGYDNAILYYRLYIKTGELGSATDVDMSLSIGSGSIEGICRVISYTSSTVVSVQVLQDFGSTDATRDWYEGAWSDKRQWPSAVDFHDGRLCFGGKGVEWGSVSDAYWSQDITLEGDSAAVIKTVGSGPVEGFRWLKSTSMLIGGTITNEIGTRSSVLDEPLTGLNSKIKSGSNYGSANIDPVVIDTTLFFAHRSGARLYGLDATSETIKFTVSDATVVNQDICADGIKRIVFTRYPETRLYIALDDGELVVFTFDDSEEVAGWCHFNSTHNVRDIVVLPSTGDDRVYLVTEPTAGTFWLTKMAQFSECVGGSASNTFDAYVTYTSPGTAVLTGLSHLEGEDVGVWADGEDVGDFTVASGQITVASSAYTNVVVGLRYSADYVSNKLTEFDDGKQLSRLKRIFDVVLLLQNYQQEFITLGPASDRLKSMPALEQGKAVSTATITNYSERPFEFEGDTESDPRIYLHATGPCEILGIGYSVDYDEDSTNKTSTS